jgi:alkanesulfonate monooxygenase SsuD/methylene tetrahydromethanopterin reductase-like flavin-dependent oxidoreductase (luciferase family)
MTVPIGVFDHMDRSAVPLRDFYEQRLRLIEAYDKAGFYCYHVAEHHSTPLGMSPSPSVFLSAVAQRTKQLRFGPLVYTLALYHPIRLTEEICMLDNLSNGRLQLGVGKGISPIEIGYYGVNPENAGNIFFESFEIIMQGLAKRTVDFEGQFYTFKGTPIEVEPLQKPHPPLWYGVNAPDSAERPAKLGMNIVTNVPSPAVRKVIERYWAHYKAPSPAAPPPLLGTNKYLVLADTDEAALTIARRAYRCWYASFMALWNKHGVAPVGVSYPPEWDGQVEQGRAIAGTPQRVLEKLQQELDIAGANYLVCRFAFGDLSLSESLRSVELFAERVMPRLKVNEPQPAK